MKRLTEVRRLSKSEVRRRVDLDSRALIVAVLLYILCVVSVGKYSVERVLIYFAFPLFTVLALGLPLRPIVRKLIFVSPFVLLIGAFNPLLEPRPLLQIFSVSMSAGMASFIVIGCKAVLSVVAVAVLSELLPFEEIGAGLQRLKVPEAFVVQLLFVYRYLFLLVEEAQAMQKARDLKSFGRRGLGLRSTASLLGNLFLRTLDRSLRIHRCMVSRGFSGSFPIAPIRPFGWKDSAFLGAVVLLLAGVKL